MLKALKQVDEVLGADPSEQEAQLSEHYLSSVAEQLFARPEESYFALTCAKLALLLHQ